MASSSLQNEVRPQYGYWTREPKLDIVSVGIEAENLGYDSLWTGESYSSDAFTPLAG